MPPYVLAAANQNHLQLPVSVKENTPPDKKTGLKISSESAKSGAGLQFLLLGRMAKDHGKAMFCSQTLV